MVTVSVFILAAGNKLSVPQTNCNGCIRKAALEKTSNPHASQFDKQLNEWNKCMQNELGPYVSFDADDPRVKQALEKCAELAPPATDYLSPGSLTGKLAEVLMTPCFHITVTGTDKPADPQKIPEYFFRGSFDADISGETDSHGREIKSRLTLELYFNEDPAELVKSWITESTLTSVSSQYNRMFDNTDAVIRADIPIDNLLAEFERRPVTCRIDAGDKTELGPGEGTEIKITDFKDEKGRTSKYFNRIIVEVQYGRIRGGTRLMSDPSGNKSLVFRLDQVPVAFTYEAPDDGDISTDKITAYSSCQILDPGKFPLELTEPDKKIAEKELKIIQPDLTADYSSTLEEHIKDNETDHLVIFKSKIKAAYRLTNTSVQKDKGTITETYRQISSSLQDFSVSGNISFEKTSADCVETGKGSATASGGSIHQTTKLLRITYDAKSGEVKKADPDNFNVEFQVDGKLQVTQKCRKPPETTTSSMPWPLMYIPKTVQGMVTDYPEFEKASGNRNDGAITGGGEKTVGFWHIKTDYTLRKTKK